MPKSSGGQQKLIISHLAAVVQTNLMTVGVDILHRIHQTTERHINPLIKPVIYAARKTVHFEFPRNMRRMLKQRQSLRRNNSGNILLAFVAVANRIRQVQTGKTRIERPYLSGNLIHFLFADQTGQSLSRRWKAKLGRHVGRQATAKTGNRLTNAALWRITTTLKKTRFVCIGFGIFEKTLQVFFHKALIFFSQISGVNHQNL